MFFDFVLFYLSNSKEIGEGYYLNHHLYFNVNDKNEELIAIAIINGYYRSRDAS